jgi:hypothetical protein
MLKQNLPNIKHWYNYFSPFSLLTHCEHCGKKEMGVLIINTPIPFVEEMFCLIMCLLDVQEKI